MSGRVLITGGAGFIGSHLAFALLERGYEVRALDNLERQVHGSTGARPDYLPDDLELIKGDLTDRRVLEFALDGVDQVVHLGARVGVAQSMYQASDYLRVNSVGTALLLERLVERPIRRLVVASSMSIYGEGHYRDGSGALVGNGTRRLERLRRGDWGVYGEGGEELAPVPTAESKQPDLLSVYALSKYDQERLCLVLGRAYGIPVVALRFFNVYGPHQALSNPYTGALAIFAARLLNEKPPVIFEDGGQRRDFVHVSDIARACALALECDAAVDDVFNVGSGRSFTILEVALALSRALNRDIAPQVTREYRMGDVRHCFADISKAQRVLGFVPQVEFDEGLSQLAGWLEGQLAHDHFEAAAAELASRRLTG